MSTTLLKQNSIFYRKNSQSQRFFNIAYLTGGVLFLAFLKFPVIRVQPGFRRVGFSAALAYPIYSLIYGLGNDMKIKRSILYG